MINCEVVAGIQDIAYSDATAGSNGMVSPSLTDDSSMPTSQADSSAAQPVQDGTAPLDRDSDTPGEPPEAHALGPSNADASTDEKVVGASQPDVGAPTHVLDATQPMPESGPPPDALPPHSDAGRCSAGPPAGSIPFVVDSKFSAVGFMGDPSTMFANCDAVGRASASAQGFCHHAVYTAGPKGWAGIFWQYPASNWGEVAGYPMPLGATKVTFWARGAVGGESVAFRTGYTGFATALQPCTPDTVSGNTIALRLTTTWTQYSFSLMGAYTQGAAPVQGLLGAFAWIGNAPSGTDGGPGTLEFYIDDIQWQ
ncbi:MAG TPA: hypothetical protein VGY54_11205 [Polyangiaceae bacterium]|jgi:hypothetical protein|nr:hypothetical protein [Polyangiaceae bacterium]